MKNYVLYNAKSKNETNKESLDFVLKLLDGQEVEQINVLEMNDYKAFFGSLQKDDAVYLLGGDGTVNHFINDIKNVEINNLVYYYPAGTGNDFMNDVVKFKDQNGLILMNKFIKDLPTCICKGKEYKFINGIGYGLDGECVAVADAIQAKNPGKAISYPKIATKLLLVTYKKCNATVEVDGVEYSLKKALIAATMKGRYYGGGLMIAPNQNRENKNVSLVVIHGGMRLGNLFLFLKIFKGTHVNKKSKVAVYEGQSIKVKFDSPRSLQVDGELIKEVTEYEVKA